VVRLAELNVSLEMKINEIYESSLWVAGVSQVILFFLGGLVCDFGQLMQYMVITLIAFWASALTLIYRRQNDPSQFDLVYIRYGFIALLLPAIYLCGVVWRFRSF
jgi:hypothetical protein